MRQIRRWKTTILIITNLLLITKYVRSTCQENDTINASWEVLKHHKPYTGRLQNINDIIYDNHQNGSPEAPIFFTTQLLNSGEIDVPDPIEFSDLNSYIKERNESSTKSLFRNKIIVDMAIRTGTTRKINRFEIKGNLHFIPRESYKRFCPNRVDICFRIFI